MVTTVSCVNSPRNVNTGEKETDMRETEYESEESLDLFDSVERPIGILGALSAQ